MTHIPEKKIIYIYIYIYTDSKVPIYIKMESVGYKNKQGNFPGLKITMKVNKGNQSLAKT